MKRFLTGLLFCCFPILADIPFQAYNLPLVPVNGNQGVNEPLGMDFHVNQAIKITSLGVWVNAAVGTAPQVPLSVELFSLDQTPPNPSGTQGPDTTGQPVPNTGPFTFAAGSLTSWLTSNWIFQTLSTPVFLQPGYYTIVASGYTTAEKNGNLGITDPPITPSVEDTGGGLISFVGESRFGSTDTITFPQTPDYFTGGGPANRYYAGNFQFEAAPEHSSALLFGANLLAVFGILIAFRTRRSRTAL